MYWILSSKMADFDYERWLRYFARNAHRRLKIDFTEETELSPEMKRMIVPSVSAFQTGERSEGSCLRRAVKSFAEDKEEPVYPKVMEYFIDEENSHSDYLLQYMTYHGIERKETHVLDGIFRRLRRIMGIRSEIMVLVTAEIIALSYYTALANAAESKALKRICGKMLQDELPHVIFQSYTLRRFKNNAAVRCIRVWLMEITCLSVWLPYRRLFRAGGYSFGTLLRESLGYLRQSMALADAKS